VTDPPHNYAPAVEGANNGEPPSAALGDAQDGRGVSSRLLSIDAAAAETGIPGSTLRRWVISHRLREHRGPLGQLAVDVDEARRIRAKQVAAGVPVGTVVGGARGGNSAEEPGRASRKVPAVGSRHSTVEHGGGSAAPAGPEPSPTEALRADIEHAKLQRQFEAELAATDEQRLSSAAKRKKLLRALSPTTEPSETHRDQLQRRRRTDHEEQRAQELNCRGLALVDQAKLVARHRLQELVAEGRLAPALVDEIIADMASLLGLVAPVDCDCLDEFEETIEAVSTNLTGYVDAALEVILDDLSARGMLPPDKRRRR
jgi:hypothetical protein